MPPEANDSPTLRRSSRLATLPGLLAILFWSTSNGLTRELALQVGPFTLLSVGFGSGGLLLLLFEMARLRSLRAPFQQGLRYLLACGACLLLYLGGYAQALALAPDHASTLVLGLVNYLWPTFILLLSPFFLTMRLRWRLALPALLLGPLGVGVALIPPHVGFSGFMASTLDTLRASPLAFGLMLTAAVSWAFYTHLARRLTNPARSSGFPLLAIGVAVIFGLLALLTGERSDWSAISFPMLTLFSLGVCGAGYALWDVAARRGDLVLLGLLSTSTPLLATCFSAWYLGERLHMGVAAGAVMVVIGALLGARGTRA